MASGFPEVKSPGAVPSADSVRPGPVSVVQAARALSGPPVALLTASAVVGSAAIAAVAVLLLAYLRFDGYSAAVAAARLARRCCAP